VGEVTHLASAGVRVLYQLNQQLAAHHEALTLRAPAGRPARAVLDLVRLPRAVASTTLNVLALDQTHG
jgi:hypothetical protein